MFGGPLEAYNANRAQSLSQDQQNRTQLENLLLGLSTKQHAKEQALRDQYIAAMSNVDKPVHQEAYRQAASPDEQGPGFGYQPPDQAPSFEDQLKYGETQAMKFAQPEASRFANTIETADWRKSLGDYHNTMASVAQQNATSRAQHEAAYAALSGPRADFYKKRGDEIDRMSDLKVKNLQIRNSLDQARTSLIGIHDKLSRIELAEEQVGGTPRLRAIAATLQGDLLRSEASVYAAKTSVLNKSVMPEDRDAAEADIEDTQRVLDATKASIQRILDTSPQPSPAKPTAAAAPVAGGPPDISSLFTHGGGTQPPVAEAPPATTAARNYNPATGKVE
jgi:HSP90 family molecular chaperone